MDGSSVTEVWMGGLGVFGAARNPYVQQHEQHEIACVPQSDDGDTYSSSNNCPNVCMFFTKVNNP